MFSIIVFAVLLTVSGIKAQVPFPEPCPNFDGVLNFNISRYMGKWYEIERFFTTSEVGSKCVTVENTFNDGVFKIVNRQINSATGAVTTLEGIARSIGRSGEAKFGVKFPIRPTENTYWVLATDYDNYALIWSCVNSGSMSSRTSWIMSRAASLSPAGSEAINAAIAGHKIPRGTYTKTDQVNCPK